MAGREEGRKKGWCRVGGPGRGGEGEYDICAVVRICLVFVVLVRKMNPRHRGSIICSLLYQHTVIK